MIEKITIEYWATVKSATGRTQHVFDVEVRRDFWDSLSDFGREQFLQEELWRDLDCGYRVVDKGTS